MFYVYVLYSLKDKKLYIGSTPDLRKRLHKHLTGYVLSTKNRQPLKLIYYEAYILESDSLRREKYNGPRNLDSMVRSKNYGTYYTSTASSCL